MFITRTKRNLQRKLKVCKYCLYEKKIEKSKIIHITKRGDDENVNIQINREKLDTINDFQYFGTIITTNGTIEKETHNTKIKQYIFSNQLHNNRK